MRFAYKQISKMYFSKLFLEKEKEMKKILLWSLVLLISISTVAVFSIAGCKKEEAPVEEEAVEEVEEAPVEEEAEEAAPAEKRKVDMEVWDWQPGENYMDAMDEIIVLFKEKHPELELNITHTVIGGEEYWVSLKSALIAGEQPEIYGVIGGQVGKEYEDYMLDLTDIINNDPEWMEQAEGFIDCPDLQFDGKIVSVAIDKWTAGIYYYKDMLEKYNLAVPETTDDLISMVPILAEDDIKVLSSGLKDTWILEYLYNNLVQQMAAGDEDLIHKVETGEISWTDPVFLLAMETYKELYDAGVWREDEISLGYFAEGIQNFTDKKAWGFWIGADWYAGAMNEEDLNNSNIGLIPVPLMDKEGTPTFLYSTGQPYGTDMNVDPEIKDVVLDFLKFLSSPEAAQIFLNNDIRPAGKAPEDAVIKNSITKEAIEKSLTTRQWWPRMSDSDQAEALHDAIYNVLLGSQTPEEALSDVDEIAEQKTQ